MQLWCRSFLRNKGEELCACLYFCTNKKYAGPVFGVVYFSYTIQYTICDIIIMVFKNISTFTLNIDSSFHMFYED